MLMAALLLTSSALAYHDHSEYFPQGYVDARNCIVCHKDAADEVMGSVHYQWRTENDKIEFPGGGAHGMLDRACGLVGSNALINYDEQCGRCHVGDSLPLPDPTTGEFSYEQRINLDCLICHAGEGMYDTNNDGIAEIGELADERPRVYDAAQERWVWHRDRSASAARSVGGPVANDACLRCHHHGQADYEYKRGTPFDHETDVHAAAGMSCTDCHLVAEHKIARGSRVTDMYGWERKDVDVSCENCHTSAPHKSEPRLNMHTDVIGCETCHIPELAGAQRRIWAPAFGLTEGPEANVPVYNEETGQYEPYSVYDEELRAPSYRWYNGDASMLAEPMDQAGAWNMQPANRNTPGAKILPFRNFISGQPMDQRGIPGLPNFDEMFTMKSALEQMAPMLKAMNFMRPEGLTEAEAAMMGQFPNMLLFDRADYFANGDVAASISIGMAKQGGLMMGMNVSQMSRDQLIGMGSQMWSGEFAGLDLPNNPYDPEYIDDMDPTTATGSFITVSHAIKLEGALNCADCHTENGRLDFALLGYSEAEQTKLSAPLHEAPDHTNLVGDYQGADTCLNCHDGMDAEVMDSVHYQWRTENDKIEYPGGGAHGMIDRACGLVGSNSLINYDEHCGRCHIGDRLPLPSPETGMFTQEQSSNLDCLICHADEGKYDTNNDGIAEVGELADHRPRVYDEAQGRWIWHQDKSLTAAQSVGGPIANDACLRCHHHGQADYEYKRGTPFEAHEDVHAAAGMHCTDCHLAEDHKIARGSRVTDMYGWERKDVDVKCENCHGSEPHETLVELNMHTGVIGCETCHIPELAGAQRRVWATTYGAVTGPESRIPNYNEETGRYEPFSIYDDELRSPSYRWYNGDSSMLAEPLDKAGEWNMQPANRNTPNAKILPFRNFISGQPMDRRGIPGMPDFDEMFTMKGALEQMAPMLKMMNFMRPEGLTEAEATVMSQFPNMLLFDRADYYANGDVAAAVSIGMAKQGGLMMGVDTSQMTREQLIGMGSQMWSGEYAGLDLPNNPYDPTYIDDMDPTTATGSFITVNHAIKLEGALLCSDCHTENGRLDFALLGYSETEQAHLKAKKTPDHSTLIDVYEGAQTCEACHEGKIEEMQGSVHYKFESELPEGYQYDEHGELVTYSVSGKLWKLCGFPTTLPQFNWLGALRDLPETAHVDTPGGCAKCHVGIGIKPFTAIGKTEPQANEANNIDCLVCHASDYQRKFYIAKTDGEPDLNPLGSPVVLAVPRTNGVMDFSVQTEAAKTVRGTTYETCLRCHAAAGGGTYQADEHNYASFKRGSIYGEGADVHADAGLECSDCHYAGGHRMKRPLNNDLSAHDVVVDHQMCTDCHGDAPHENAYYNGHTGWVACTTCHASTTGGATYKDFSIAISPDPDDPLGLYSVKVELVNNSDPVYYTWFNGTTEPEIMPRGSRGDGKIYPYKAIHFNQPRDANGHAVPIQWGPFFKTGNMTAALTNGRSLYEAMFSEALQERTGIPDVPGEFDHYAEGECGGFSISHGIKKYGALTCTDCHTHRSVLDFETLGYTPAEQTQLEFLGPNANDGKWMLYR